MKKLASSLLIFAVGFGGGYLLGKQLALKECLRVIDQLEMETIEIFKEMNRGK